MHETHGMGLGSHEKRGIHKMAQAKYCTGYSGSDTFFVLTDFFNLE